MELSIWGKDLGCRLSLNPIDSVPFPTLKSYIIIPIPIIPGIYATNYSANYVGMHDNLCRLLSSFLFLHSDAHVLNFPKQGPDILLAKNRKEIYCATVCEKTRKYTEA